MCEITEKLVLLLYLHICISLSLVIALIIIKKSVTNIIFHLKIEFGKHKRNKDLKQP